MDLGTRDTLLTVGMSVAFLAGIALVLFGGPTPTVVGIALIAVSSVAFVVDAKDLLERADGSANR